MFHVSKKSTLSKPKIVCAVFLFRMKNAYRDVSVYVCNLLKTCQINRSKPILIRIYYDKSIQDQINKFNVFPSVECIRYTFPQFFDGTYHSGVFGTFVRFYTLFDTTIETRCIFDADTTIKYSDITAICNVMKSTKSRYWTLFYKHNDETTHRLKTMALSVLKSLNLPLEILTNFLQKIADKDATVKKWLDKNNDKNNRNNDTWFKYRIDEYWINVYLVPEILHITPIVGTFMYLRLRDIHYELYKAIKAGNPIDISKLGFTDIDAIDRFVNDKNNALGALNIYPIKHKKYMDFLISCPFRFNKENSKTLRFMKKIKYRKQVYTIIEKLHTYHVFSPL